MLEFDPERYDAVIFDCDGTLVDTMPLHHDAWRSAFQAFAAPFDFTWDLFCQRAGMTLERTVEELNLEFRCGLPPALVAEAQRVAYRDAASHIRPIHFVVEFARSIARTHPIAVASGSSRASVEDALTRTSLLPLFSAVVTADDVVNGKPAPDIFVRAATLLSMQAGRCLVIEDGQLGVLAAHRAGMDAYRIDRCGDANFFPTPRNETTPE